MSVSDLFVLHIRGNSWYLIGFKFSLDIVSVLEIWLSKNLLKDFCLIFETIKYGLHNLKLAVKSNILCQIEKVIGTDPI